MLAFPLYSITHFIVVIWCLYLLRTRVAPGAAITAMIAAGLVYDNSIISLGASIGAGPLLESLSWPRFAMHALLTPFMLIAVTQMAVAGGVRWAASTAWKIVVWLLVVGSILIGALDHLIGLEIRPACFKDVLRYTANLTPIQVCADFNYGDALNGHTSGPPIPSIIGNFVTLIFGFALWRRTGWLFLMLGSIVMFMAGATPSSDFGLAPGNGGEVILLLSYAATAARFSLPKASQASS